MPMPQSKKISDMPIAEQRCAAMGKIIRTVNICETSTLKMRAKLLAHGFDCEAAEDALAKAQESSLIDDLRYANCLVRSAIASRKGFARVEQELRQLGIDIHDVEAYIEFSDSGENSQLDMALEVLRRNPSKAKNRYAAAYRKLMSKGYSSDIASEASRAWCEECGNEDHLVIE